MIQISIKQKGNNVIEYLKGTPWSYNETITTDYEINMDTSIIFLSIRFHLCKPEYIYKKIKAQRKYKIQVLLVLVDVNNYEKCIAELFYISDKNGFSMVLAFSNEEAGKYIKSFELRKSINLIRKRADGEREKILEFITSFPKINKTDALQLISNNLSLFEMVKNVDDIKFVFGIGDKKIDIFKYYLDKPFEESE
ncbi:Mating-type switching protein swi10 [Dictyocoela muelleri]|nr:Mating-type switching protein swi10 [Dictyocoela muelleri]